ncbi:MAG: PQQ-dependent sugar dehydrogenase [Pseudomonadota bacterium]
MSAAVRWATLTVVLTTLGGCGGGGSSAPPPAASVDPTLNISDASVTEGNNGTTDLIFTVRATVPVGASANDASVEFATSADTATAGMDYTETTGTLVIPGGTTTVTLTVSVLADRLEEADETLTVTLLNPSNAMLAQATATGTIVDDDAPIAAAGLDARPDNQTCVAPARAAANAAVDLNDAFPGLASLSQPTKLLLEPGGNRWFALQKSGEIMVFGTTNPVDTTEYLDLNDTRAIRTNSEGGLLGMAFHPNYPTTPEIFLSYTVEHSGPAMRSVISRWILDDVITPGGGSVEQIILQVDQDFDNHNGGDIGFGPDGLLYIGLGDGGSGNDPLARSQDTTFLLGSMLRINVADTGAGYTIPADNPFAGNALCGPAGNANDCPEIYAWGLRNPWRWSFDRDTGALWLADVGQSAREEVNLIERGGNYGWRCREGTRDTGNASDCTGVATTDPVTEYTHDLGNSITGGYVYRGTAIDALVGQYVFADFVTGRVWAAVPDGSGGYDNQELINANINPAAFAEGSDRELYIADFSGRILRLDAPVGAPPGGGGAGPADLLSDTGCVAGNDITQPYEGLLPYRLNAPFWSDGADKDRYIGLPNGTTMTINAAGDFDFPEGTVIVKNFRLGGALVETRHLVRYADGEWTGYTYEWNTAQTEATRVRGGKTVMVAGQEWIYPSETDCMSCHTQAAGFALGPEIAQLNGDQTYATTGRTANQLATLDAVMMFSGPLPGNPANLDALANPEDSSAPLAERARAYLHSNCAGCHRPNGPTPSSLDLRYSTTLASTNGCDVAPSGTSLGIANARLIAPGNAAASMIVARMQRRDVHAMPPIGSNIVDTTGVSVVADWIDALNGCN